MRQRIDSVDFSDFYLPQTQPLVFLNNVSLLHLHHFLSWPWCKNGEERKNECPNSTIPRVLILGCLSFEQRASLSRCFNEPIPEEQKMSGVDDEEKLSFFVNYSSLEQPEGGMESS